MEDFFLIILIIRKMSNQMIETDYLNNQQENTINDTHTLQNQMLTYWKKVIESDLKLNPSKKREYQLQRYLLDYTLYSQENEMP
jgi:hypothetical protein